MYVQPCLILFNAMACSPPGSSIHGISRQEYWSGLLCPPSWRDLPKPRDWTQMTPTLAGRFFITSATWEALIGCVYKYKEIYFKELVHKIIETGKSKFFMVSQQTGELRRTSAAVQAQKPSAGWFCHSNQAFNWWNEAHPHHGEQSAVFKVHQFIY